MRSTARERKSERNAPMTVLRISMSIVMRTVPRGILGESSRNLGVGSTWGGVFAANRRRGRCRVATTPQRPKRWSKSTLSHLDTCVACFHMLPLKTYRLPLTVTWVPSTAIGLLSVMPKPPEMKSMVVFGSPVN